MLWVSVVHWILFGIGCSTSVSVYSGTIEVSEGKNVIKTDKFDWTGINRVWYYRPSSSEDSLRLVMVLHGMGRNGEDYLDSWVPYADENNLFVVAPEFSDEQSIGFVGSLSGWGLNTGIQLVMSCHGFQGTFLK
jgi:poly(3-hydroxybutyrate) depolymerase